MITDLQPPCSAIVLRGTDAGKLQFAAAAQMQPVADVRSYLSTRKPQPHCKGEEHLLITLPRRLQDETKALVRACHFVAGLVKEDKLSVQAACNAALRGAYKEWQWKLDTFRPKFDAWSAAKDWVVLVNLSKAPASWRNTEVGLAAPFLAFVSMRYGEFRRSSDGRRQAIFSIWRQWRTGKNPEGDLQPIPGYEANWEKRDRENLPAGWSESNIRRQVRAFGKITPAVLALLHDGQSAARALLPQNLGTRRGLRFLEKVTFDDVRTDWLIFNPKTGQAEEMWVLVARDEASAMVLGFVMLPATIREDGKATHIGARQMKELAGYLLQTYPLPPYIVHWVVERGTATLADAVQAALGELFNDRITVHYTSMIGGNSPTGYKEKAKGNSRGKASHESHNRLFHTQGSFISGQTGANWSIRPAELNARVKECEAIHAAAQHLPATFREEIKYPLPTPARARELFQQICLVQNFRDRHNLEDFQDVVEWWDGAKWQPVGPARAPEAKLRTRKEMPVERAMRLIREVSQWDRVSLDIIITFLAHNQRFELIEPSGEIKMMHQGKTLRFGNPSVQLPAGLKVLCYHNAEDPEFLHVTTGDGRVLGTWALRGRSAYLDREALEQSMRYTYAARKAAMDTANDLAAPQRDALDQMRQHNARLLELGRQQFNIVADAPGAVGTVTSTAVAGYVQAAPESIQTSRDETKQQSQSAREAFLSVS